MKNPVPMAAILLLLPPSRSAIHKQAWSWGRRRSRPLSRRREQRDRRADIFSFGAVLYEMLSGKRAFGGDSVADTLATVMKLDPDWSALPKETPASVDKLVRRCLRKDRKQRLQAISEARIVLQDPMSDQDYEGVDAPVTSRS